MNPINLRALGLFIFVFVALSLSTATFAALALVPNVPGYSASSGGYRAPAGSFTAAANGSSYGTTGTSTISGKPITVPANLRMASNAGQFAKNAMRLNPWAIAGTLAAGWLIDQGLEYIDGSWQKTVPDPAPIANYYWDVAYSGPVTDACNASNSCSWSQSQSAVVSDFAAVNPNTSNFTWASGVSTGSTTATADLSFTQSGKNYVQRFSFTAVAPRPDEKSPFPDADWDSLPDPIPVVAPELPFAPYMPDGAPVEKPNYDFVPFSTPIGEPYTKPDGSTAQPMAKVSPNGDAITVDTYDQPLTSPDGTPVADPVPQDTPEPAPDQPTQCDKFPESLGCAELGTVEDSVLPTEQRSIASISPVSVGGVGSCPAPLTTLFMGHTITMSWDLPCQAAGMLKPLILALAWLSAGVIFIGGVRQ